VSDKASVVVLFSCCFDKVRFVGARLARVFFVVVGRLGTLAGRWVAAVALPSRH